MKFNEVTLRVLVRKDYGACFDFYVEKMGLTAVWGDRNGPYTSFAVSKEAAPCFAIFSGENMSMFEGYSQPVSNSQPDSIVGVIPSEDLEADYQRMKEAGVEFLGEPQRIDEWELTCTYFRDPEGNLFELNDSASV